MRFIFYIIILIFGSFFNSSFLNALTQNGETFFSSFWVNNYCNSSYYLLNNLKDVNLILVNKKTNESATFLNDSTINSVDNFSNIELLKKEILSLNDELERLNQKLSNLENENYQLKMSLEQIAVKEQNKVKAETLISELQKEVRIVRSDNIDDNIPDQYIKAQNLLIIGDIAAASKQFQDFLDKNSCVKEDSNYDSKNIQKINDIYIAYSNYWLGKISIIENNYNKAVHYFAECYRLTNFSALSLNSLVGLIESLTNLNKTNDACIAIRQFNQDYQKACEREKNFSFPDSYLKLIEKYKSINRCQ